MTVTPFFFNSRFVFFVKRQQDEGLTQNDQTRTEGTEPGPVLTSEEDVREEVKETSRCFFTDLW